MKNLRFAMPALVASAMVFAPFAAEAAAFETPVELMQALNSESAPIGFSVEMHGHSAPNYGALWLTGTAQEKDGAVLLDAKSTVDVVMENGKIRAKFDVRSTGERAFFNFKDIQGNFDDSIMRLAMSFGMKKWIELPMDEMSMWGTDEQTDMMKDMFTMTSATNANGNITYTLVPSEMAMMGIRSALEEMAMDMGQTAVSFEDTTFTIVITTDAAGKFVTANGTINAKSGAQMFTLKGSAWRAAGAFAVTAPTEVYEWDDGFFGMGGSGYDYSDWPSWIDQPEYSGDWTEDWAIQNELPRDWDEDTWNEETDCVSGTQVMPGCSDAEGTMQWDDKAWDEQEAMNEAWTPECNLSQLKRGECPNLVDRYSRRR